MYTLTKAIINWWYEKPIINVLIVGERFRGKTTIAKHIIDTKNGIENPGWYEPILCHNVTDSLPNECSSGLLPTTPLFKKSSHNNDISKQNGRNVQAAFYRNIISLEQRDIVLWDLDGAYSSELLDNFASCSQAYILLSTGIGELEFENNFFETIDSEKPVLIINLSAVNVSIAAMNISKKLISTRPSRNISMISLAHENKVLYDEFFHLIHVHFPNKKTSTGYTKL